MGLFSLDENPEYLEKEYKLYEIKNIILNNDLTDKSKIFYIKKILFKNNNNRSNDNAK